MNPDLTSNLYYSCGNSTPMVNGTEEAISINRYKGNLSPQPKRKTGLSTATRTAFLTKYHCTYRDKYRYSSFLTLVLDGYVWSHIPPQSIYPRKEPPIPTQQDERTPEPFWASAQEINVLHQHLLGIKPWTIQPIA
jgi:hypothetical protein